MHPAMLRNRRWSCLLPPELVRAQVLDERDRAMMRARDLGATYTEIGRKVGITGFQVKVQIEKMRRRMQRCRTPIEIYLDADGFDLQRLARLPDPHMPRPTRCPLCGSAQSNWRYR